MFAQEVSGEENVKEQKDVERLKRRCEHQSPHYQHERDLLTEQHVL